MEKVAAMDAAERLEYSFGNARTPRGEHKRPSGDLRDTFSEVPIKRPNEVGGKLGCEVGGELGGEFDGKLGCELSDKLGCELGSNSATRYAEGGREQVTEEAEAWRHERETWSEPEPELETVSALADNVQDECDDLLSAKLTSTFSVLAPDEQQDQLELGSADSIHKPRISATRPSFGAREWPKGPPVVLHPNSSQLLSGPASMPSGGDAKARVMSADERRRGNTLEQAVRAGLEQQRRAAPVGKDSENSAWHSGHHSGLGAHIVGVALGALTHARQQTGNVGGTFGPKVASTSAAPAARFVPASPNKRASDYTGY